MLQIACHCMRSLYDCECAHAHLLSSSLSSSSTSTLTSLSHQHHHIVIMWICAFTTNVRMQPKRSTTHILHIACNSTACVRACCSYCAVRMHERIRSCACQPSFRILCLCVCLWATTLFACIIYCFR